MDQALDVLVSDPVEHDDGDVGDLVDGSPGACSGTGGHRADPPSEIVAADPVADDAFLREVLPTNSSRPQPRSSLRLGTRRGVRDRQARAGA